MFLIKPLKPSVMNPDTGAPLEDRGIRIPLLTTYWFRRERDKDVSITAIEREAFNAPVEPLSDEKLNKKKGVI